MPDYRRVRHPGGRYFFTVSLLQRHGNDLLTRYVDILRAVVKSVPGRHPFRIHGRVVLSEHLHCVIDLPPGDVDFAVRWRLIKREFSRFLPATERRSQVRQGEANAGYGNDAIGST